MKLVKEFYTKETILRNPPRNLKMGDENSFGAKNYTIEPSALYLIRNVRISPLGIIYRRFISLKDFIVCYAIDFKKYKLRYLVKGLLQYKTKSLSNQNKYLILFDNYSGPHGFAHWLCDGLTRIAEMNDELIDYVALFPAYFKNEKLYLESLRFFKFDKIEYLPDNTFTKISELYIPSHIAGTGNFHPKNIQKLRHIILSQLPQSAKKIDYIYISRAKSSRRHVENEKEVGVYLKQQNFETIYFEDHTFQEQIQLISQAKLVVSIHGAALALIMFMKKNSSVLEFRKKTDTINNMYFSLANAVDLNYYYLNCDYKAIADNANNFNLVIDLQELKQTIDLMLLNTSNA